MRLRGWECSLVFVVCYLCSHTGTSSNHRGLLAPVNISTKVIGDKVKVHWKDHNRPELVSGAYAAVSEISGGNLGSPVFIHAEDVKTKSITLSGLMPQMTYSIRVVLFSKDGYSVSSTPVTVTMSSYLHEAKSAIDSQVTIEVNHVTHDSATLSWKFPVTHSIHGLQFKLNCTGWQTFIMNGRTIHKKYQTKSYISDALSKYTQEQLIEDLVPNVNYTCELATYNAASKKTFLMVTAHFTTLVGSFNGNWSLVTFYKEKLSQAGFTNNLTCVGHEFNFAFLPISILSFEPGTPGKPRVVGSDSGIKVFLTAAPDRYGPISHYTLIAVPVHKDKTQPITTAFTPVIPYNKVVGKAMPSHSASKSDRSVAFIIGTYPGNALPSEVVLGNTNEVLSAFKPNQYYVVVLAAFTKSKENPKSLFSLSSPSSPPFVISNTLYMHVTQHNEEETVGEASRMVLWIAGTIAICGIAVIILSLGVAYALKKKGYKIPLKWSDGDVDSGDYVGLTADKLVYGEKTYVPMKPLRSAHTQQSTRVASEATIKFDNPHFNIAVSRTKGLLEDIQVAMDCSEASTGAENPPHSPTENSQPPTTYTIRYEEISPGRTNKKLSHSPFTYSTPGELEKLQTGTFSLPRSAGPIKTPRRRAAAVTKSPLNKGIPTPAPCKPTTVNNEEPLVTAASNEELLTMPTVNEESLTTAESLMMPIVDEESLIITTTNEVPLTTASIEETATTDNNDEPETTGNIDEEPLVATSNEPLIMSNIDKEQLMNVTVTNNDGEPPTMSGNNEEPLNTNDTDEPLTITDTNEESLIMTDNDIEPLTMDTADEEPLTTTNTNNNEEALSTTGSNEEPLTSNNTDEGLLTTAINTCTNNNEESPITDNDEEHSLEQI